MHVRWFRNSKLSVSVCSCVFLCRKERESPMTAEIGSSDLKCRWKWVLEMSERMNQPSEGYLDFSVDFILRQSQWLINVFVPVASPLKLLLKTTQVLSEARNENSAFPKGEEEVGAAIKDDLKWTELSAQDCFNQKGLRTKFLCFCSCFFGFFNNGTIAWSDTSDF